MSSGRRAGGVKSEASEAGRREKALEKSKKGPKVKQEKSAEENKRWKKSRRD
jgi:hypothetical protein